MSETTFKFTGKNGGDPGEYWRSITAAAQVSITDALKGGRKMRDIIRSLTSRGVDYAGRPFERYTDEYARRKGTTRVDLRVSGKMIDALRQSVNGQIYEMSARGTSKEVAHSMAVGVYNSPKQAMKGAVHNEGLLRRTGGRGRRSGLRGGVMRIPKRRWLDTTSANAKVIQQVMTDSMVERMRSVI